MWRAGGQGPSETVRWQQLCRQDCWGSGAQSWLPVSVPSITGSSVSRVPSREVGWPWGLPGTPWDLLKALPGAVWVPADDMEGRGERASPALAQRPSAFHYCLLLLDRAAATSGPHVCIQIPGGPGLESRSAPWELSALGQFLNLDRYFLKIPASGLSRGLVSSQAVDKRSPEWYSAKALPLTGSRVSALVFQDLVTMVEQLARFLGVSCDKAQLESLIEHCHQLVDQCCNAEALPVGRGMACLALGFPPPPC